MLDLSSVLVLCPAVSVTLATAGKRRSRSLKNQTGLYKSVVAVDLQL